ncbi:hypothetical protein [Azospirillum sp.]|uniref:hypothetical protein n=1 Tax=Azospirillum sp. TaxID=34012 RepID=UPI002D6A297B|nr:hypothetical protein [Azospirillum sp.]HYD67496.1 hypothetical protein [Azospirillum sp.]
MRQIDQAYPLVRAIAPDLPVERWRSFATALTGASAPPGAPAGIMTVQNDRGYIHGLFSYAVKEDLRFGRILSVDNFVVLDLFNVSDAASSLLQTMEDLGRTLHCTAIHTNLRECYAGTPAHGHPMLGFFRDEGHDVDGVRLCKALAGDKDNMSRPLTVAGNAE